ncbi:TPA: hypothetical protein PXP51_000006 [Yersinia enterocolitica]|nr:hypothetical protein [Yersinia enterocolitica]
MRISEKAADFKNNVYPDGCKVVSLDLCHWYQLEETKENGDEFSGLKNKIDKLVSSGDVIFPISYSILYEFYKRRDQDLVMRRLGYADKLSKRLSFTHYFRLRENEIISHFNFNKRIDKKEALTHWFDFYPIEFYFDNNGATNEDIEKITDSLLNLSPKEWLKYDEYWSFTEGFTKDYCSAILERIESYKKDWSRRDFRKSEICSIIRGVARYFFGTQTKDRYDDQFNNLLSVFENIYEYSEKEKIDFFMNIPTIYMEHKTTEGLVFDKGNVKINDIWDIEHSMVLPYSDIYMTDGPTVHFLKALKIDKKFDVKIISKLSELDLLL